MARPQPQPGTQDETLFERIAAWVIDGIVILLFFFALVLIHEPFGVDVTLALVGNFVYKVVLEAAYGQTIGKKLLGVVVVKEDGSDCTWVASILRNVLRVVDGFPVFYLVGLVAIFASDDGQRIGDKVASTMVAEVATGATTLTVTVEDGAGDALQGANVDVDGRAGQTDAVGAATFELEDGDYVVDASHDGYEGDSESISIAGRSVDVTLTLTEEADVPVLQPSDLLVDEVRRRGEETYLVLRNDGDESIDLSDAEIDDAHGNRHPFPGAVTIDPATTETFRFGQSTEFDPDHGTPLVLFGADGQYEIRWEASSS